MKILDFDIENRPLAYLAEDYTTPEVTVIAACWMNQPDTMRVWLLGQHTMKEMLKGFKKMYDQADMVTGHYIRKHDLPILNGAMIENNLPVLSAKLTQDTKLDLVKQKTVSASQENLSSALRIKANKLHVSNTQWRRANRLEPAGVEIAKRRAELDVIQHMELYNKLLKRGLLKYPKVWKP